MSEIFQQLLLQLALILVNAFFAATEIAVISLNEKKIRAKAEDGDKKSIKMLSMIEEPTRFLSTIQIGITIAGFLGSAFAADNFAERLTGYIVKSFNISEVHVQLVETFSVIIITLVLSFFTLVLGELVPKRVAMKYKEKLAESFSSIISFLSVVLKPIIWLLTISTNAILFLFGIRDEENEETVSEEDIVIMLDAGADEGTLKQGDIEYIKNVFKLDKLCAVDIMTHRKKISFISSEATEEEILDAIQNNGYTRMPVYAENIDEIIGVLHARDYLLKYKLPGFKLEDAMFEPTFVPETVHLDQLFKDMQTEHNHIVIVVNEYGVPSGIVTMEDIIEELVGEIWDESDEAVDNITKIDENTYKVLCTTSIEDFFEFFELDNDEEAESTTVNGWLTEKSETIPDSGFTFNYENLVITVMKADELMAHEIKVEVLEKQAEEQEE